MMPLKSYVRAAFGILPENSKRRLIAVVVLIAGISVLDLLALVLVLAITAVGAGTGNKSEAQVIAGIPALVREPLAAIGIDSVTGVVAVLGLAVVLLFVGKAIFAASVLHRILRYLARQEAALTHRLLGKLMQAPLTFHLPRRYLDMLTDITVGAEALAMKAIAPTIVITAELALVLMLMIGLLTLAPVVAVAAIVYFATVLAVLNRWIGRRAIAAGHIDVETTRSGMIVIQWALGGYREVVTRGVSDHFVDLVGEVRHRGAASRAEVAYLNVLPRYFLESALVVGMAFVFAIQLPFTGFAGAISGLTLFAVTGFRLLPSMQRLQSSAALIKGGQPFGEQALKIMSDVDVALAAERLTEDEIESHEPILLRGGIDVIDVSFSYPQAAEAAIAGVTTRFAAGRMTALVGASGSGKSTLIDVLLGLLPPSQGSVLVDGQPLRQVRRQWLKLVGYVPQSIFLMPASVRDNVAFGVPADEVHDTVVWAALRRASLDEVVRSLPGALDYRLGDAGSGLSGGQRQRLGIARALYHEPQVLIFDEATSALDVETEAAITSTLTQLEGLTKIVVAHRLSTIRNADQVLFFKSGALIAQGSFDEVCLAVPDFARQAELSGFSAVEAQL